MHTSKTTWKERMAGYIAVVGHTLFEIWIVFLLACGLVGVLFLCSQLGCQKPSATINSGGGDATLRQQTAAAVIESPELEKIIDARLSAIVNTTVTAEVKNQLTAELNSIIQARVDAVVKAKGIGDDTGTYKNSTLALVLAIVCPPLFMFLEKLSRRSKTLRKIDDAVKGKPKDVKFAVGE